MKVYKNKLGLTCVEPEEGYLLRKDGETFKMVVLNKNDKPDFYEEVIDYEYVKSEEDVVSEIEEEKKESLYVLTSPNGNKFKLTISDDGELDVEKI